jgi:hypothetical protein
VAYSFPCRSLSHPLLTLFLGILFFVDDIVNGIIFLYSLSICSLLVYRKATDFCKLILHPATLLKLFMVSRSFLVEFFWSSRYKIMSSANRNSLTTSFPVCIPFIYSSCLTALVRNSKSMFNKSRESGRPLLVLDFRGNGFHLSPFSIMLAKVCHI